MEPEYGMLIIVLSLAVSIVFTMICCTMRHRKVTSPDASASEQAPGSAGVNEVNRDQLSPKPPPSYDEAMREAVAQGDAAGFGAHCIVHM